MRSLFSKRQPKTDIKHITGEKKPLLVFNPESENSDTKDDKKKIELKKVFLMPEKKDFTDPSDAEELYEELKDNIDSPLDIPIMYTHHTTLCKGYGEGIYDNRIKNEHDPDIIVAIINDAENEKGRRGIFGHKYDMLNVGVSDVFGFAYIDIREQHIVKGKTLVINAICSAKLKTNDADVNGIGSFLIDSIKKIGTVFNCDAILVKPTARTVGFFKKMGFEELNDKYNKKYNKDYMILNLYNFEIVHNIVGDSPRNSETGSKPGSRKSTGSRKGTGSKKGGKLHRKPHKYTRKSR